MFSPLKTAGFDIIIKNHAGAILSSDFTEETNELIDALLEVRIPAEELIVSGGGEAKSTQRLRTQLYNKKWHKHNFQFEQYIDDKKQSSITHEIDHIRRGRNGTIALEIEWNNKDPFFDRDLENFQRLHAQSAISLGVIITRGSTLQENMVEIVKQCLIKHDIKDESGLSTFEMKDRTKRQRQIVEKEIKKGISYTEAFAKQFVGDKFGKATTHWNKLKDRINRGVGSPCPLLLIGLPASIINK